MNISLTPHLEEFVKQKVESGRYTSSSEVVREALRLLEERDRQLDALRREIQKGLDSGPPIPGNQVFADVREKIAKLKAQAQ